MTIQATFRDGSLAGQTVEIDNEAHHWLNRGKEYYERISEAPTGQLVTYFRLVTEGYRCPGWAETVRGSHARPPLRP